MTQEIEQDNGGLSLNAGIKRSLDVLYSIISQRSEEYRSGQRPFDQYSTMYASFEIDTPYLSATLNQGSNEVIDTERGVVHESTSSSSDDSSTDDGDDLELSRLTENPVFPENSNVRSASSPVGVFGVFKPVSSSGTNAASSIAVVSSPDSDGYQTPPATMGAR